MLPGHVLCGKTARAHGVKESRHKRVDLQGALVNVSYPSIPAPIKKLQGRFLVVTGRTLITELFAVWLCLICMS